MACGQKDEPYNLWLGGGIINRFGGQEGGITTLISPRFRHGKVHGTAVYIVPDYVHHANVHTM